MVIVRDNKINAYINTGITLRWEWLCSVLGGLNYKQKIPIVLNLEGILFLFNDKEHFLHLSSNSSDQIILILKSECRKILCMLELNQVDYQADQGLES